MEQKYKDLSFFDFGGEEQEQKTRAGLHREEGQGRISALCKGHSPFGPGFLGRFHGGSHRPRGPSDQ